MQSFNPPSIAELLKSAPQQLRHAARQKSSQLGHLDDSPQLDARLLLAAALEQTTTYLMTWPERRLTESQLAKWQQLFARRLKGEPIAHILARREFWSLPLETNASTLIPRPDTECLVAAVLALALPKQARILDLGTGTGAIALALKSEQPQWHIDAVDSQSDAVALARRNAERLDLAINIWQSDWFAKVETSYDVIVSNPPYIDATDPHLSQGDVQFEPRSALVAEEHGLADIRAIALNAEKQLTAMGWLLVEHGWQQGQSVRKLFEEKGYKKVSTLPDYANVERVTKGQKPKAFA